MDGVNTENYNFRPNRFRVTIRTLSRLFLLLGKETFMYDINIVTLTGRSCADPEVRYFEKDGEQRPVSRFSMAVQRNKDITDFLNISCYGGLAETVSKYLAKGMRITVSGRLQTDSYTNKDGVKVNTFEVVADKVILPDKPKTAA